MQRWRAIGTTEVISSGERVSVESPTGNEFRLRGRAPRSGARLEVTPQILGKRGEARY